MKWSFISGLAAIAATIGLTTAIAPVFSQTASPRVTSRIAYQCDDGKGFIAEYLDNDELRATFGTRVFVLPQVEAASGAKYSNGSVTIFTKGDEAMVDVGDTALFRGCVAAGSVPGMW